jgi:hypothetical protein
MKRSKKKTVKLFCSLNAVQIGDVCIKASSFEDNGFLFVIYNDKTLDTEVKYFVSEDEASSYLESRYRRKSA